MGGGRPPPFITFTITSKVAVYAPVEWALGRYTDLVSSLVKIWTLWLRWSDKNLSDKIRFWSPPSVIESPRSCESLLESQMTGTEVLEPEAVRDGESGESCRHHHEHLRTQGRLAYRRLRSSRAVSHGSANNFI